MQIEKLYGNVFVILIIVWFGRVTEKCNVHVIEIWIFFHPVIGIVVDYLTKVQISQQITTSMWCGRSRWGCRLLYKVQISQQITTSMWCGRSRWGCRLLYKVQISQQITVWKKTKNRGIILTNGGGKNAQKCINIHSNCIIMQFWEGWLLMGSGALVVGGYAKLKPKKFGIAFW